MNDQIVTYEEVQKIVTFLRTKTSVQPKIGIICGSGLGGLADLIEKPDVVDYKDIPGFPVSTVIGHKGQMFFGHLNRVPVLCMKGRFHPYEGYSLARCTLPVRVMKYLGVQTLIVTNAAGGLEPSYKIGDIMIIRDHIFLPGFAGNNPLRGVNDERFGTRFPSLYHCYDPQLVQLANTCVEKLKMSEFVRNGCYVMLGGPNFETVAEARMLHMLGADAVGMSTVHEVIVARHSDLRVLGFSLITDMEAITYELEKSPCHEDVLKAATARGKDFEALISEVVKRIDEEGKSSENGNGIQSLNGN